MSGHGEGSFLSTQWSLVLQAKDRRTPEVREAMERLCRAYWYPLYVFVRRKVGDRDAAEDLTQEFFARILDADILADVAPQRGRFRS
jgi:DNA-directed RNA polymerase specialized sigma24 family protein